MRSKPLPALLAAAFLTAVLILLFHNKTSLHSAPPATNVAVIIDNRPSSRLIPLILHFASVLGPQWPIILFTTVDFTTTSSAFNKKITDGSIRIYDLPKDIELTKHSEVSAFLTKPWLWEQLAPARHVLHFQLDSIICSNAPWTIEDFLQYDIIGAPIQAVSGWGLGYNGGFSLRNREMVLDIIRDNDWAAEVLEAESNGQDGVPIIPTASHDMNVIFPGHTNHPRIQYEDQWFFKKFMELPHAKLPPYDVSKAFAVESVNNLTPFGYHKPGSMFPDDKQTLEEYCPEYILATQQAIPDE